MQASGDKAIYSFNLSRYSAWVLSRYVSLRDVATVFHSHLANGYFTAERDMPTACCANYTSLLGNLGVYSWVDMCSLGQAL